MLVKSLAHQIQMDCLFQPEDTVVVAVSGGPDSVALLHLLHGLNTLAGWSLTLHVAHLNHCLREQEAAEDAAFVQAMASELGLCCTIAERNIRALAEDEGRGLEEIGRRERYAFIARVCIATGAKVVALGHQADDNVETLLHRILRGTGLRGLAGIRKSRRLSPASDIRLVRPLLGLTRELIRTYLHENHIAYRQDSTNLNKEPMRNRIRLTLLPLIRSEINPQVGDALLRLSEQADWWIQFLRETVERTFESLIISRTDQELVLNADALMRKSRIVQTELIRMGYIGFGLGEQDLGFAHVVSVLNLLEDPTSGRMVQLPGGMTVEKRYHRLIFSLPSEEPRETLFEEVVVHVPGVTGLPLRRLEIICSVDTVDPKEVEGLRKSGSRLTESMDYDAVRPPLVVRSRRPGERFHPLGASGTKKIGDFLTDAKVNPRDRRNVPVLCDQLGPIWVVGYRIDDRVKLTGRTRRALRITARSLDGTG